MATRDRKKALAERGKKVLEDRDWWRRVGAMFNARLIGWTDRHDAQFTKPLGECSGVIASKLLELDERCRLCEQEGKIP